jgi:hypothetical protein
VAYRHMHGVERDGRDYADVGICLDRSLELTDGSLTCKGGIICETKRTPQPLCIAPLPRNGDSETAGGERRYAEGVRASGDGTVPYISMRHSLTWNAPGKGRLSEVVELEVCDVMWIAEPAQYVS